MFRSLAQVLLGISMGYVIWTLIPSSNYPMSIPQRHLTTDVAWAKQLFANPPLSSPLSVRTPTNIAPTTWHVNGIGYIPNDQGWALLHNTDQAPFRVVKGDTLPDSTVVMHIEKNYIVLMDQDKPLKIELDALNAKPAAITIPSKPTGDIVNRQQNRVSSGPKSNNQNNP